jgi:hypothetical protein
MSHVRVALPLACVALALVAVACWSQPEAAARLAPPIAINVRDYGAVGDGKVDDTEAIQRAIDNAYYTNANGQRAAGGTVYLPPGLYRTTRPLRLHAYVVLTGDDGECRAHPPGAWIESEAEAGIVFGEQPLPDGQVVAEDTRLDSADCSCVVIKNLAVRATKFAVHTLGRDTNYLRVENCRFEGAVAAFVVTGNMFFSRIDSCGFQKGLWILPETGRFNTSEISNILIGLHGIRNDDWAIRLEGCVQCVTLRNITFEVQAKGILLDAKYAGVNIAIDGVWSYDVPPPAEVIRIKSGEAVRVSNVLATDGPSELNVEGGSRLFLQGVLAGSIDLHGCTSASVFGCSPVSNAGPGSVIEGEKLK